MEGKFTLTSIFDEVKRSPSCVIAQTTAETFYVKAYLTLDDNISTDEYADYNTFVYGLANNSQRISPLSYSSNSDLSLRALSVAEYDMDHYCRIGNLMTGGYYNGDY